MGYGIESQEVVMALLLVKALLALLAALIFVYYKMSWDAAKRHLPVHLFYAKWKTVRHVVLMGIAALGLTLGFSIELAGVQYGMAPNMARFLSSIFEIGSMFFMLYFFFTLALEDVPVFQHMGDAARHKPRHANHPQVLEGSAGNAPAKSKNDWTVAKPLAIKKKPALNVKKNRKKGVRKRKKR